MKLIIKSEQNYKTHVEQYKEEFECSVDVSGNSIFINFENGTIKLENDKLIYQRGDNKIIIEPNKTNECDYDTEYGMFVLDIKGISVEKFIKSKEELDNFNNVLMLAEARYEILMTGVESYENRIKIGIKNE